MAVFIVIGALSALSGVAAGAFGAHVLEARLAAEALQTFQTGVQYHLVHALGLVLVGLCEGLRVDGRLLRQAGVWLLAGQVLFSGSLYLLALTGSRGLGWITPLGGLALLAGWALLAAAAWRGR